MEFSATAPAIGSSIPHKNPVTSLSYHGDGNHLFVATEKDSKVMIVDAIRTGKPLVGHDQPYRCDREGVSCLSATHNDYCVLTAGNKQTSVQYWSLYDNKILRKFRGHSSNVTEINLCPTEDMFLSSSKDKTVRLWNLQQAGCMAKLELPKTSGPSGLACENPRAVFDSTGMVFTIMAEMQNGEGNYIHLYDARNYQGGAFSELKLTTKAVQEAMRTHRVTNPSKNAATGALTLNKIDFNASGNRILVQSAEGLALVLDGYEGTVQRIFQSSSSSSSGNTAAANGITSCFTPDEKSVLMGSDAGIIDVYDIQSGTTVKQLEMGGSAGPVSALACNPKYQQIASGCATNTCMWIW